MGFLIGLMFTQRSGNYFVMMFDDYSATLPLIIVVIFQTLSVAWVYGADRYTCLSKILEEMTDIEHMSSTGQNDPQYSYERCVISVSIILLFVITNLGVTQLTNQNRVFLNAM